MRNAITKQQIETLTGKGTSVRMIDIRSVEEYKKQHIPDVVNIPVEELQKQAASFSRNDTIVCVCNHGKERSQKAAEELYDAGFINTYYLTSGTSGWLETL